MRHLVVLNQIKKEKGFTLFEVIVVVVIMGVMAAISAPNLLGSKRDQQAKEVFSKIRDTLIEAQTNANRLSSNCTVTITTTSMTGSPSGCVLESTTIDSNVVSVTSTGGLSITYDFRGNTSQSQTIKVAPKDFSGNPITANTRCIFVAPRLGMIRTGFLDTNGTTCNNTENARYDNFNP
jgi:prepilin-type N-terminal cleavage/methylation domain-containing protein